MEAAPPSDSLTGSWQTPNAQFPTPKRTCREDWELEVGDWELTSENTSQTACCRRDHQRGVSHGYGRVQGVTAEGLCALDAGAGHEHADRAVEDADASEGQRSEAAGDG